MLPIIEKKCIVHLVAILQGMLPFCILYSLFTASGLNLAVIEWMMTGRWSDVLSGGMTSAGAPNR